MSPRWQWCDALELREAIARKAISPVELMRATLARIEALEPALNAFVTLAPEQAMADAREAERAVTAGEPLGALHGIPVSVKDLVAVRDLPLTFGSRTMAANVARIDAPAVERLRAAGACIVGKTTTSEFGCKAVGDSPLTGITRNPWDESKTPGGSSSGAAASVAAGMTSIAIGTDGGGSIRIPAALTGLVGLKGHFGRVPVHPPSATVSLAHVGPIARSVRDAALLLQVIAGYDERDPHAIAGPVPAFIEACDRDVRGMRIAWSPTLGFARPRAEIVEACAAAVQKLADSGCEIEQVEHVITDPAEAWVAEFHAGIAARLDREWREQRSLLDPAVAQLIERARNTSAMQYHARVLERQALRESVRAFFTRFDLLVTPTLPCAAFDVARDTPPGLDDRDAVTWAFYTYAFNLTGHPAASVPAGFTRSGLPIGLQLVARAHCEVDVVRAAAALERAQDLRDRHPACA